MRHPINWLVVALSLAFGLASRSPVPRVETLQVQPFEPAGRTAVPASMRRERNLEFGYVRLDAAVTVEPAQSSKY